jgi:hypothetical protein
LEPVGDRHGRVEIEAVEHDVQGARRGRVVEDDDAPVNDAEGAPGLTIEPRRIDKRRPGSRDGGFAQPDLDVDGRVEATLDSARSTRTDAATDGCPASQALFSDTAQPLGSEENTAESSWRTLTG